MAGEEDFFDITIIAGGDIDVNLTLIGSTFTTTISPGVVTL